MFCEGLLGTKYLSFHDTLNEEYIQKESIITSADDEDPFTILFYYYYTVDNLLRDKNGFVFESEEFCGTFCKEHLKKVFVEFTGSIVKKYLKDEYPKYFNFLLSKVTTKILENYSENFYSYRLYLFIYYSSVNVIKNNLKKFFEGRKLSEKSLIFLAIQCLEFDI